MTNSASLPEKAVWKASSVTAGVVGGMVARKLVTGVFSSLSNTDAEPPLNPADRRVDWTDAVAWAVSAGVGAGLGRLVSQRAAAAAWESASGSTPPGVAA